MKKKSILFVNESLACAGGEKSLLNLLSSLDYDKYDVYLQLQSYGNPWDKLVDQRVKILPEFGYSIFCKKKFTQSIVCALKKGNLKWVIGRFRYSISIRMKRCLNNVVKARLYWATQRNCFDSNPQIYDYAVAYAHGFPTFYVCEKVKAKKKLAWINVTYLPTKEEDEFIEQRLNKFDKIVAVSEEIQKLERQHWPHLSDRIVTFRDIINPKVICDFSKESIGLKKPQCLTLVTLGRLAPEKGYDITLEAASILKSKGLKFKWFVLGKGPLEDSIRAEISKRNLENEFILLGVKENPYPFLKLADIYVQTSTHEGFGLAIAEARILNIPVVTTKFNTVHMQMVDGKNGLLADLNGTDVSEKILRLATDDNLYKDIVGYLRKEKKGNLEIIDSLYSILDELDSQQ